jgi:hypothetical protein
MLPPPSASLGQLAKMADSAVAAGPTDADWPYRELVKGLAEYREGHFAGAIKWLRKVSAEPEVASRAAQAFATLAMAEFQLGQTNAARSDLTEGIKLAELKLGPGRINWNDVIIAQNLLHEANDLVTGNPKSPSDSK